MKRNRYYIILLVFISTVLFGCVYKKHSKDNIRQEKIVLTMAMHITVKMYPCSGETDTGSPEQGYRT